MLSARHLLVRVWNRCENPVMDRELRTRMRGARSHLITAGYTLLVMACVLIVYYYLGRETTPQLLNQHAAQTGRAIWMWGCITQALLLPLVVPALTCGAITLEREREMLELLLLTRQSPFQICLGKLGSGVSLGLVLVLASIPVLSLTFVLGGVAPSEVLACVAVLAASVVAAGALGLAASALAPKTASASAASYLLVGFALLGVPLLLYLVDRAYSLSMTGSDLGILAVLGACLAITFVPAMGLATLIHALQRRRSPQPVSRTKWLLTGGLCWSSLLALLCLPGMTTVLLEGWILLALHPVMVIADLMNNTSPGGITGVTGGTALRLLTPAYRWLVCSITYLLCAVWLFQLAVLRVRTLRSG